MEIPDDLMRRATRARRRAQGEDVGYDSGFDDAKLKELSGVLEGMVQVTENMNNMQLRLQALKMANNFAETPAGVVGRANAYLTFLKGEGS